MSAVLAFDIGLARTGVASGDTLLKTVNLAGSLVVKRGRHDWQAVDRLLEQWQPSAVIIGQPNTQDAALNKAINRFKHHIQQHKLPCIEIDESLTSSSANHELSQARLSTERKIELRDQLAASYLLSSYFAETE